VSGTPFDNLLNELLGGLLDGGAEPNEDLCLRVVRAADGEPFLQTHDLDASNIFDWGVKVDAQMEKTIQAAGIRR
jgi:hypothetical protein